MFEQSLLPKEKTRRPWTVALAVLIEAAVIGIMVLIPLLYVQALPMPEIVTALTLPPLPPPPPPPPPAAKVPKIVSARKFNPEGLMAPREIPKQVAQVNEPVLPAAPEMPAVGGVEGGIPGGTPGGIVGGIAGAVPNLAPPPPPPPPIAEAETPSRIHVGGQVEAAMVLQQVEPVYPKLAAEGRISGVVKLKAIIGTDGHIKDLKLISGHPLLVQSALNAVRQWIYKPTVLNGKPVEVDTEINVTFAFAT